MSVINFDLTPFIKYCSDNDINIDENAAERLSVFGNLLLEWNEKINLTAITEPEEIVVKHFIDSVSLLKYVDLSTRKKLIDVGSGAGFPGMVIKICRPETDVTLLDGHAKRFIFLEDLMKNIDLNCKTLHMRAELASKETGIRENFDIATARAVAALPTLLEYCMPFVSTGGIFAAMKGPSIEQELSISEKAITVLGGGEEKLFKETLPDLSIRAIVTVKKISQTPSKYPRASAKISKQPL